MLPKTRITIATGKADRHIAAAVLFAHLARACGSHPLADGAVIEVRAGGEVYLDGLLIFQPKRKAAPVQARLRIE